MNLANCSRCGRVFSSIAGGKDVCPACIKEEEDHYLKVFRFLSTRPSATAQEIAQATEVDIKEIYRYVRENRLRLAKVDFELYCESCGTPITQGKMCENCRQKLSADIKNELDKTRAVRHPSRGGKAKDLKYEPQYLKERRGKERKD